MSNKYVCIHGHFYQPPRENPWLEEIEVQDSAYPYRDWNERITAECYSPNTAARILGDNRHVIDIINNYSRISFNFGPTLLSWLEDHSPDVYESILEADKISMDLFSGHGSAIAQVYNHMIMPLSHCRDKKTQLIWGIEDFRQRFKREPEGIWLAETAVDTETLELAAEQGIKFTILAPRQAGKIKKINEENWFDVSGGKVDPRRPYLYNLPSGNKINLFFYDGNISQDLAFGNLLSNGENLSQRLISTLDNNDEPQLAHIATDGETYGHHQKHGDMALAYAIHHIESNSNAKITVYGEYLEKFPPEYEVQIIEDTSWSCVHGVERWRSDCGCNSGRAGWNQQWRAPLREALDWLRDTVSPIYEKEAGVYTNDVRGMRDQYIKVILNREPENIKKFFASFGIKDLTDDKKVRLLKLLEIQRHTMLMYTSCGWFFDEISGIETVQVILYAARVIQLARELELGDFEEGFLKLLEKVPGNIPEVGNGRKVYESYVKPAIIDLNRVAAHYAVSSMFEDYSDESRIFCYSVKNEKYDRMDAGRRSLVIGRSLMRSLITHEEKDISFAFLHLGDHNLNGGVKEIPDSENYETMRDELKQAFEKLNITELILLMDKYFDTHNYNLWHLFKDESRKVLYKISQETLEDIEHSFRTIYENHYPVMQAMRDTNTPLPKAILTAVEFIINQDLVNILENEETIDLKKLNNLYNEANKWKVEINRPSVSYSAGIRINNLMAILKDDPLNTDLMNEIDSSLTVMNDLQVELNIWKAQNIFYLIADEHYEKIKKEADKGDEKSKKWIELFHNIEKHLGLKII